MVDHQLAIGLVAHTPDVEIALAELAPLCRLSSQSARLIVNEVGGAVGGWQAVAASIGIPRAEIQLMRAAFAV